MPVATASARGEGVGFIFDEGLSIEAEHMDLKGQSLPRIPIYNQYLSGE